MKKLEDMTRERDWYIFPEAIRELANYDIQPSEDGITFLIPEENEDERRRVMKLLYLVLETIEPLRPSFAPMMMSSKDIKKGLGYYDGITMDDYLKDFKVRREIYRKKQLNSALGIKEKEL